jgi:predicted nucleic acid-binding protein
MGLILDSSVLVAFERRRFDLERLLTDYSPPAIAAVTAAELLVGVERADTQARRNRRDSFVKSILDRIAIVPFDLPQARIYAHRFAGLARQGQLIGDRDLQIAATALSLDYDVATLNVREFERISGLRVLNIAAYELSQ